MNSKPDPRPETATAPAKSTSALARSLRSVGAGLDGAAFVGEDEQGRMCTVHRVRADVAVDPVRRRRLLRRLAFHEQAARENVPGLLTIRGVTLEQNPPVIVVEQTLRSLADVPHLDGATGGASFARVVDLLHGLAQTLALAHTEGIVHSALTPKSVRLRNDEDVGARASTALCFLGLRTMSEGRPDAFAKALWPHDDEEEEVRSVDDAYAFGGICAFMVAGEASAMALLKVGPREAATIGLSTAGQAPADHPLLLLARDLLDAEPAWRPTLSDAARRLGALLESVERKEAKTQAIERPRSDRPAATVVEDKLSKSGDLLRVGRFKLVSTLGAGAMGTVYRGVDEDTGAVVAVKLLQKSGVPSPKALKRFRKEARLLSELHNPGIARFLDAGEENGQLFLVTELVEGNNLSQIVKARGPFAEKEAIAIVVDLLRALVDVHDNGIVHRDIKPENMILVDDPTTKGTHTS